MYEGVARSVARIYCNDAMGNGVIFDEAGLVLTNAHVVRDCKSVTVKVNTGKEYPGRVVCKSTTKDIAIIKIAAGPDISKATLGDSDYALPANPGIVIGYPQNLKDQPTILKGLITALGPVNGVNYVQTDVPVNAESSGSPVVNYAGEVIGIIGWEQGAAKGEGVAVAIN
ncbi:MAG: trypsin-like peptidase domain-containing protein [Chloroflexi bacterium]|nr:trypsin-like peptidase domain-containing protein [Chloroflexota bacterium]